MIVVEAIGLFGAVLVSFVFIVACKPKERGLNRGEDTKKRHFFLQWRQLAARVRGGAACVGCDGDVTRRKNGTAVKKLKKKKS